MAKACILAALLAVACTTTVSSALSTATSNQTGTWIDLFQPPYDTGVDSSAGLSCNTRSSCYVLASYNKSRINVDGLSVLRFPGVANGVFIEAKMPNLPVRLLSIAIGGPADAPKGAVTAYGIAANVQYPVDNVTFMPSKTESATFPFGARASANGQDVLVINANPSQALFSTNGGESFNVKPINVPLANNCTYSHHGAMIDKNTWYVTMGSWINEAYFARKFVDETVHTRSNIECADSAQIVKTTDGGNTWTTQFSHASNYFTFSAIDCFTATHCVAVGRGDYHDGAYIYRTIDGHTWSQVLFKAFSAVKHYRLTAVRVNEHGHYFVSVNLVFGGETYAFMLTSVDEGATWVEGGPLPNIAQITGLSFTSGGYGFATAETIYQTTTILRYDPLH